MTPFWLRRPVLLARCATADRERPDLAALERIDDPERFVWAILPHAARTFSACIVLLPAPSALPAAVAYLYCRMLDTYEDLVPDRAEREASLLAFAARLEGAGHGGEVAAAPAILAASDMDARDRAHLLLVARAALVDQVFASFDPVTRGVIADLVREMAEGMQWSSAIFAAQGGVLRGDEQLAAYCRHVLGNPVVFAIRLVRLGRGLSPTLAADEREHAMRVGEMVQLANVTRDVEKDLRRGIAYDASLAGDLHVAGAPRGERMVEDVRVVRERLLRMALVRAPSYARIIDAMELPRLSLARASAVVMLLFTERHFRGCTRLVGLATWPGPDSSGLILLRGVLAAASRDRAAREVARIESAFLVCGA